MSAPPDTRQQSSDTPHPPQPAPNMSAHNAEPAPHAEHQQQHSNVRHIPIFVEGRDEPVINKSVDHGTHFGDTKPAPQPQQPQSHPHPHIDRDQYFADDGPASFHHPTNFSRAFGTPFIKGFKQGPQPFTQQKAYPQSAFARGASPQRSQSPKPPPQQPQHEEHFVKVPVHHEQATPKPEPQARPQQKPAPHQPSPQRETPPPQQPKPQPPPANDPITQILGIQTDVLNLMTEVENFTGTKKDKRYLFLDEMLTRNLIKLDNIETEGKENIRLARKEAIRCIQKCIAVLEAKAESNSNAGQQPVPAADQQSTQDVEMNESSEKQAEEQTTAQNGEVEMKEAQPETTQETQQLPSTEENKDDAPKDDAPQQTQNETPVENKETPAAQTTEHNLKTDKPEENVKVEKSPKKKVVKKIRDKSASKDSKEKAEPAQPSNKADKVESMQVDDKGDKPQVMEVDPGASASQ